MGGHSQMRVGAWLQELGQINGSPFRLDDAGRCCIRTNQQVDVVLDVPDEGAYFVLSVVLTHEPLQENDPLFREALALNLFGEKTRGACVALDTASDKLVLCYRAEAEGDFLRFQNVLSNFALLAKGINQQLSRPIDEETSPETSEISALFLKV